jgi:acyl carrier protein
MAAAWPSQAVLTRFTVRQPRHLSIRTLRSIGHDNEAPPSGFTRVLVWSRRVGGKRNTRPPLPVEYRAPTTADEEKLVRIWENAIGVAPIGIHDDFFDLGGDSIIAIQTQFSAADEFGISLSTNAFFDFPTIASLAEQIRKL